MSSDCLEPRPQPVQLMLASLHCVCHCLAQAIWDASSNVCITVTRSSYAGLSGEQMKHGGESLERVAHPSLELGSDATSGFKKLLIMI